MAVVVSARPIRAFESVGVAVKTGRRHPVKPWDPKDLAPRCDDTERARDIVADLIASDRITESEAWAIEHLITTKGDEPCQ